MRNPTITAAETLAVRLRNPHQVADTEPESAMPPYMESLLAHLRLLVGVPFEYLVPDPRLLPPESIRFFYLDRSWTDRLVDGVVAVGKTGTREQAHHQAHAPSLSRQLDHSERIVRDLQRARGPFATLKGGAPARPADVTTGFLLRSSAVAGWAHMDVRAYRTVIADNRATGLPFDPNEPQVRAQQLTTLRLERLAPSVLLALFEGVPKLVTLEEPHHGVAFGVHRGPRGLVVDLRHPDGTQIFPATGPRNALNARAPMRRGGRRVLAVSELRKNLQAAKSSRPEAASMPDQRGGGAFALEVLDPPWRQRFEGTDDQSIFVVGRGAAFRGRIEIARAIADPAIAGAFQTIVERNR
jgi:hypothetical protein